MVAGINAPTPSGIPNFNEYFVAQAGKSALFADAVPLQSWYNVVFSAPVANAALVLPPVSGGVIIYVNNYSGFEPNTINNNVGVFGFMNPNGRQDGIINISGGAIIGPVTLGQNQIGMFFPTRPQLGFSNNQQPGVWTFKPLN